MVYNIKYNSRLITVTHADFFLHLCAQKHNDVKTVYHTLFTYIEHLVQHWMRFAEFRFVRLISEN